MKPFNLFENRLKPEESIMILGTRIYQVRFDAQMLTLDAYRRLDVHYLRQDYTRHELDHVRDVQILDESRDFGFIYRKIGLANAPAVAYLDFFIGDEHEGLIQSYHQTKFQVGPDLIDD